MYVVSCKYSPCGDVQSRGIVTRVMRQIIWHARYFLASRGIYSACGDDARHCLACLTNWHARDTSHDFNMAAPSEVVTDLIAEDNLVELWADYPCIFDVRSTDFKNRDLNGSRHCRRLRQKCKDDVWVISICASQWAALCG